VAIRGDVRLSRVWRRLYLGSTGRRITQIPKIPLRCRVARPAHRGEWRRSRDKHGSGCPPPVLASGIPTTLKEGASDEARIRGPSR
jgi:hypothetical protein